MTPLAAEIREATRTMRAGAEQIARGVAEDLAGVDEVAAVTARAIAEAIGRLPLFGDAEVPVRELLGERVPAVGGEGPGDAPA